MRPRRKVGISEAKEGSEHKSGKGGKWTLVRQRREVGISEARGKWAYIRQRGKWTLVRQRGTWEGEAKGEVGIGEAKEGSGHK